MLYPKASLSHMMRWVLGKNMKVNMLRYNHHTVSRHIHNCLLGRRQSTTFIWILQNSCICNSHDDDIFKWKHFSWYWSFVKGIHRSPVVFPHKGQWRRTFIFSLICAWANGWANTRWFEMLLRTLWRCCNTYSNELLNPSQETHQCQLQYKMH